jgi:isocitrate lyase
MAEHGFTAFWQPIRADQEIRFSDRREVFKMIRKMIDGNCS